MNRKVVIVTSLIAVASFSLGRYTTPSREAKENLTTAVHTDITDVNRKEKLRVVKREVVKPDGRRIITTVTANDVDTTKLVDKTKTDAVSSKSEKVVDSGKTTLSAIAALDPRTSSVSYGASVSKPVLGPLTLGVFGLSSGVAGASIGFTF